MIRPVFLCVSFPLIACSAVLAQDETSLNRGAYGSVMTPEQVMRELGPGTGLLPGDQAYEGRPVKSVSGSPFSNAFHFDRKTVEKIG